MTKKNNEGHTALQSAWTTGHAAAVTSLNQTASEEHADQLAATPRYSEVAGQPFVVLGATRTGMGVGPVLPNVLDLVGKPKR
ncbi:hypothetical protein [Agrobacterium tumefaciens]|uniref:hypothetical protein n=1 Tax=Agrobacterium tumefaciens TaxID=358 RepID=UPI0015737375|nr:hypothetical protein [Agrobacterium tumefaciens]NTB05872.1 hypothetical protein [Agrobacterium tumefaciens]